MDVMDSPSSSVSSSLQDNSNSIHNEQTLIVKEEYCDDVMAVSYNIISGDELSTNNNNDINDQKSIDYESSTEKTYKTIAYGPIVVKVNLRNAPTLKTGRRSRFLPLEGDAAAKRELRRQKNRELAKRLKEKRINIEHRLIHEISELETHEKSLTEEVRNLKSYKQFLEKRYQQKISTTKEMIQKNPLKIECD
jgi:hypothetical protein